VFPLSLATTASLPVCTRNHSLSPVGGWLVAARCGRMGVLWQRRRFLRRPPQTATRKCGLAPFTGRLRPRKQTVRVDWQGFPSS